MDSNFFFGLVNVLVSMYFEPANIIEFKNLVSNLKLRVFLLAEKNSFQNMGISEKVPDRIIKMHLLFKNSKNA